MRKTFDNVLKGIAISFIVTTLFMMVYAKYGTGLVIFKVYTVWLFFGIVAGAITFIFSLKIKMQYKIILHIVVLSLCWYISMISTFKLFNLSNSIPISAVIIFVLIYIFISFIFGVVEKKNLEKLNENFK